MLKFLVPMIFYRKMGFYLPPGVLFTFNRNSESLSLDDQTEKMLNARPFEPPTLATQQNSEKIHHAGKKLSRSFAIFGPQNNDTLAAETIQIA